VARGEFSEVVRAGKLTKSEFSDDDRGGSLLTIRRVIDGDCIQKTSRFAKLGCSARLIRLDLEVLPRRDEEVDI
jgi:hypothetical protein